MQFVMTSSSLADALQRAEHALARLEAVAETRRTGRGDEALRAEVRAVITELDRMIGAHDG